MINTHNSELKAVTPQTQSSELLSELLARAPPITVTVVTVRGMKWRGRTMLRIGLMAWTATSGQAWPGHIEAARGTRGRLASNVSISGPTSPPKEDNVGAARPATASGAETGTGKKRRRGPQRRKRSGNRGR